MKTFEVTVKPEESSNVEYSEYDKARTTLKARQVLGGVFAGTINFNCTVHPSGPDCGQEVLRKIDSRTGGVKFQITHPKQISGIVTQIANTDGVPNEFEVIVPFQKGLDIYYLIISVENGRVVNTHAVPPTERRDFKFQKTGKYFVLPY